MGRKRKRGRSLPPSFWKALAKAVVVAAAWIIKKVFFNHHSKD